MEHPLLRRIQFGTVLGDGAMGTQLYARGIYFNRNFDALNLSDPHLVKAIHRDYIEAGAQTIETNTFGGNRYRLEKHGFDDHAYEINRRGAEIAKRCASEHAGVLVGGAMGPLGKPIEPMGKISEVDAHDAFYTQVKGLLDGGTDFFILETFLDLHEIILAIHTIRELSDLPILAMMTVDHTGLTAFGRTPSQIAMALNSEPVELIGLNCSTGPQNILDAIIQMRDVTDKPLAAFPNAGEPKVTEGRLFYLTTPEYFAEFTKRMIQNGVRYIGGCCGTNPDHIRAMSAAIHALQPSILRIESKEKPPGEAVSKEITETIEPRAERSRLGKLLDEKRFPVSCEIHPPRSSSIRKILKQVELLMKAGIDVVNIPDGPRASARMSAMALAHLIESESGMLTMLHYTCRDRNILGIQSDLLGAEALGLSNILCVTGDPPKLGDYPMATAVFDVDAIGLLHIASRLNRNQDLAGNPVTKGTSFFLGAGFNPGAINLELEIERLWKKIDAGAEFILTQPVFDQELLPKVLDQTGKINVPVFVGILPLVSYRNAEFFHNEVPGMEVPASIRQQMKSASDSGKEYAVRTGIEIAQKSLAATMEYVEGAYIMPPFGKVELAVEVVSVLSNRKSR